MPLTAAAGVLSLVEQTLANTIAACASFQTAVGALDETEALDSIHFGSLPDPPDGRVAHSREELEEYRPYALLYTDEETGFRRDAIGADSGGFTFADGGVLKFLIEQDVGLGDVTSPAEAERKFKNLCGQIIDELAALAGGAGYLAITCITFQGPGRSHQDAVTEQGDYFVGLFTVRYDEQGR